jgi:Endonuclease NucS
MPIHVRLWHVKGKDLPEIKSEPLTDEARLQEWLAKDRSILGLELLIIGRQVPTDTGSTIDLLAIDAQANLVVLELKRDKTPHEIVAQTLDHAAWVSELSYDEIEAITKGFTGKQLWQIFNDHFGNAIPKTVNSRHSMVILASELDASSERIMLYLSKQHGVPIQVLFLAMFKTPVGEFLGRATN